MPSSLAAFTPRGELAGVPAPALYVVLTLTFASLRPPPIPQPQMYHGVSPAATSGGNNGNMVSLRFSFSFRLLSRPSCFPIFNLRHGAGSVAPPAPKTAEPTAGQLESPYSNFYCCYLISQSQSRVLSQEISALGHAGARLILVLSDDRGPRSFFFFCSVILIDHDNIYRPRSPNRFPNRIPISQH